MKHILNIALPLICAAIWSASCQPQEQPVSFSLDQELITIGAEGGAETIRLSSNETWYAQITTYEGKDTPWISVSPMNGKGSAECQISIDTTLINGIRKGNVRFYSGSKKIDLRINQTGYAKIIHVEETEYDIPEYATYGNREITLEITANIQCRLEPDYGAYYDGETVVEASEEWFDKPVIKFDLDRGERPRTIKVKIPWQGNTKPYIRKGSIKIVPEKTGLENAPSAEVFLTQAKAPKIENNRLGDSLAIVAIARSLNFSMREYEGERMDNWSFVTLWSAKDEELAKKIHESHPRNCFVNGKDDTDGKIEFDIENYIGRVRSVSFSSIDTKEDVPAEVAFLSTVAELGIVGNTNAFIKELHLNELTTLTQLRALNIGSFGLRALDKEIVNLKHLEELSLWGNTFNEYPAEINGKNFPELKYLDLAANRKYILFDMSTTTKDKDDWGGLSRKGEIEADRTGTFPIEVFSFPKMEYLSLSNNYIIGEIPDEEEINRELKQLGLDRLEMWTDEDLEPFKDSLTTAKPEIWDLRDHYRILPKCRYRFSINLNVMEGKVPDWILYHPFLMEWGPDILIFNQDSATKNLKGKTPVLTGIPEDPNYYYDVYPGKKPEEFEDEENI